MTLIFFLPTMYDPTQTLHWNKKIIHKTVTYLPFIRVLFSLRGASQCLSETMRNESSSIPLLQCYLHITYMLCYIGFHTFSVQVGQKNSKLHFVNRTIKLHYVKL